MLVLSTKPLQKLTGTGRRTDRQTGKPICREAAPPKMSPVSANWLLSSLSNKLKLFSVILYHPVVTNLLLLKIVEYEKITEYGRFLNCPIVMKTWKFIILFLLPTNVSILRIRKINCNILFVAKSCY